MSSTDDSSDNEIKRETRTNLHETSKRKISLSRFLVAFVIVVIVIVVIELVIEYQLHERYKTYLRIGEVAIIGYFTINSISNIFYKYTFDSLDKNAEAGRVLIRIMGAVIIIAIIISYLSRDPRPFKIGDKITIFGNTGIVFDIGLQNSRLKTEQGDIIIAPNSAILGTTIVIRAS